MSNIYSNKYKGIYHMSWDDAKIEKLKELWGKGKTASQIAEIIGGISRNAVIGKAHRLNLSAKIRSKNYSKDLSNKFNEIEDFEKDDKKRKKISRSKFRSLLIEKDFEPENPKQLEELSDDLCKWPIGHPDESSFYFCGRKSLKDFSYCKLHILYAFVPKNKKEDVLEKNNDEVPKYIKKKIKSA